MNGRVPRLTIGMPVYNGESRVTEAVEGLLKQDFKDFEIVLLDNASLDATAAKCLDLAERDRRVRYVRQPSTVTVNANFDAVFALARSELFMWAADDDAHEPDYVSRCVAELDANRSAVLAASDARQIHPTRGDVGIHSLSPSLSSPNPAERLRALLRHGGWTAIYGVIRRSALSALPRNLPHYQPTCARSIY